MKLWSRPVLHTDKHFWLWDCWCEAASLLWEQDSTRIRTSCVPRNDLVPNFLACCLVQHVISEFALHITHLLCGTIFCLHSNRCVPVEVFFLRIYQVHAMFCVQTITLPNGCISLTLPLARPRWLLGDAYPFQTSSSWSSSLAWEVQTEETMLYWSLHSVLVRKLTARWSISYCFKSTFVHTVCH